MRTAMNEPPPHVWYASYGSNLLSERFMCYLRGGVPAGSRQCHAGCPDATPPTGEALIDLRRSVVFSGERSSWGVGGVAFVRETSEVAGPVVVNPYPPEVLQSPESLHSAESLQPQEFSESLQPSETGGGAALPWVGYGRMYRITGEQFLHVVAQENDTADLPRIGWGQLGRDGAATLDGPGYRDGWYRRLLLLGEHGGEPICTFTSPEADALVRSVPAPGYAETIVRGLRQMLPGLGREALCGYLLSAMGQPEGGAWHERLRAMDRSAGEA